MQKYSLSLSISLTHSLSSSLPPSLKSCWKAMHSVPLPYLQHTECNTTRCLTCKCKQQHAAGVWNPACLPVTSCMCPKPSAVITKPPDSSIIRLLTCAFPPSKLATRAGGNPVRPEGRTELPPSFSFFGRHLARPRIVSTCVRGRELISYDSWRECNAWQPRRWS